MGKKSKRKGNIVPTCYHGCITKKEFNCGEHHKIFEGWDKETKKGKCAEFINTNECFMADTAFARFIIAHVTADYLQGKDDDILQSRLLLWVYIRYDFIPRHEGNDVGPESEITKNYNKYSRDVETKRGRIKLIAREIPCDCMEEKRIEAKSMEKATMCSCCRKEFSKEMLHCLGCDCVQYCSKKCSKKDWPTHKAHCRKISDLHSEREELQKKVQSLKHASILVVGVVMVMIGAIVVIMKYRPGRMLELEEF